MLSALTLASALSSASSAAAAAFARRGGGRAIAALGSRCIGASTRDDPPWKRRRRMSPPPPPLSLGCFGSPPTRRRARKSPSLSFSSSGAADDDDYDDEERRRRKSGIPYPPLEIDPALPPLEGVTAAECLRLSADLFESRSVPEPDWSAVHLLSDALDLPWEGGYRRLLEVANGGGRRDDRRDDLADRKLTESEARAFASSVSRRLALEPLQYILGRWDFLDFTLRVRAPCLCPRPETEELVERAAGDVRELLRRRRRRRGGWRKVRILDVGCGTGAIGIALAREFGRDGVEVTAIDVDPAAVELSNENAADVLFDGGDVGGGGNVSRGGGGEGSEEEGEGHDGRLYRAILCSADGFSNTDANGGGGGDRPRFAFDFDVVVSNPPYIPRRDMSALTEDVVGYERHGALCGGDDGMDVIRDIVRRLPEWSSSSSSSSSALETEEGGGRICWLEVDTTHPALMEKWLALRKEEEEEAMGKEEPRVVFVRGERDLSGRDRFVKLHVVSR